MARLVVNPGSPTAWEIELKPGTNTIGRGFANDFKIADPSVSGSHCQIVVDSGNVIIKDLGSTNGTYINRAPVTEATLRTGQTIHLGGVEMRFESDAPATAYVVPTPGLTPPPPIAVSLPPLRAVAGEVPAPMATTAVTATSTGPQQCKSHPKTPARYYCNHCHLGFCELCVTSRSVGGAMHKYCRRCGAECATLEVHVQSFASRGESFYRRLPGAFAYPARGAGIFVLIICSIVLFGLGFISAGFFSLFATVAFLGYLFSFMQTLIHSTAAGDEEMPGFPPFDGLFGGFVRLVGAALVAFGPYLVLYVITMVQAFMEASSSSSGSGESAWSAPPGVMIATQVLGCLYFPMALLSVAMKDTPLASNPLVVLPAIFKVPLEYLVAVLVMAGVMALRASGEPLIHNIFPRGLTTHSMSKLFGYLGAKAVWNLVMLYLLAVNMRILGLLYLTKKQKLGWFDH